MTNQEKWDEIVSKIEELGDELQDLCESSLQSSDEVENALFGLRLTIDELSEQELD